MVCTRIPRVNLTTVAVTVLPSHHVHCPHRSAILCCTPCHSADFDLGQICRGCGDCSSCTPCPAAGETPAPTPDATEAPVSVPPFYAATSRTAAPGGMVADQIGGILTSTDDSAADGDGRDTADAYDCSRCADISAAQMVALASYDNGGKKIVCDPTCMDSVSDHIYCNCKLWTTVLSQMLR